MLDHLTLTLRSPHTWQPACFFFKVHFGCFLALEIQMKLLHHETNREQLLRGQEPDPRKTAWEISRLLGQWFLNHPYRPRQLQDRCSALLIEALLS